ncbi:MAG: AMP-binding protein [Prevotella sp.]|nr:AMP-binding protein [Prevotella sp.]
MTLDEFREEWNNDCPRLLVHTSGSTGMPKPMWVEKQRMAASARKTCTFLGLQPGDNALLCLPLDFIAGKMMAVRAMVCGLNLISVPPDGHPLRHTESESSCPFSPPIAFAAMTPMQVYNSLQVPCERQRLTAIHHLIIGGGAIDKNVEKELRCFPHAVWSTYGMTETLSHIALRRINGPAANDWYVPFDSVEVGVNDKGCLIIDAPEVAEQRIVTNDLAEMATDGRHFRILGRLDNVICSGGIKIQAEEAERMLRPHLTQPFMITSVPDARLGEAVVLLTEADDLSGAENVCRSILPKYWQPRHYCHSDALPVTATGKPDRMAARRFALSATSSAARSSHH